MQIEIFTLCNAATRDGSGKLKNFGDYSINLLIDGRPVGSTPFYVHKLSLE
jgi:hypothetical protein